MINEEKILTNLLQIIEEIGDKNYELPSRLERIRSFAKNAIHTVSRPVENTVENITSAIDKERDRRIDGGFTFMGMSFQSKPSDRENIMGAAQLALAYIGGGGDENDTRWPDGEREFLWITEDNSTVALSAAMVIALFQAGVAYKSALTFYARALKDEVIAAEDPTTVDVVSGWPN